METYRNLVARTAGPLAKAAVHLWLVSSIGTIAELLVSTGEGGT